MTTGEHPTTSSMPNKPTTRSSTNAMMLLDSFDCDHFMNPIGTAASDIIVVINEEGFLILDDNEEDRIFASILDQDDPPVHTVSIDKDKASVCNNGSDKQGQFSRLLDAR
jgi:hypothetical protein